MTVRRFVCSILIFLSVSLGSPFVASAVADGLDQDGRRTGSTSVDGSYAQVVGNGFSAVNNQCVLYSALSYDSTAPRQIESGLARCNNWTIDGTCTDGYSFVERYNGSSFYCTSGYSFTNNTAYDATTYRQSSTSTTFTGHVNGVTLTQSGFGLSDNVQGYAWGEATGGASCPSPSKGTFNIWERYDTSTGWHYVTSSTAFRHVDGTISGTPCWGTIAATSSDGGFYVD